MHAVEIGLGESVIPLRQRPLFFLRENPLPAAPLYGHLAFCDVQRKDGRTFDLEFILVRRFEGDRG